MENLVRITPFIRLSERHILMNAHGCVTIAQKIQKNRLYERCLHIIYNYQQSSFSELLEKDGSVSIHMRNIQSLVIEMFRVSRNISLLIMNDNFKRKDNSLYNLRKISEFSRPLVKSVHPGSESVSFPGPKILDMLPDDYKDLNTFENKVKKWKPKNCPCRLCKVYINNIGFV